MTIKDELKDEINSSSQDLLQETLIYLRLLKQSKAIEINNINNLQHPKSTVASVLEYMEKSGGWVGHDFEYCLEIAENS